MPPPNPTPLGVASGGEPTWPPESIKHPDWCDPAWCTAAYEGDHRSASRRVQAPGPLRGFPLIELQLWLDVAEPVTEPANVQLRLIADCDEHATSVEDYELHPVQMRALAAVLVEMADQVDKIRAQSGHSSADPVEGR